MNSIQGLAYQEVSFDQDGAELAGGQQLIDAAVQGQAKDVFVLVHGWNSSEAGARGMYQNMFRLLAGMLGPNLTTSVAAGVFWPARALAEDDGAAPGTAPGLPGGSPTLVEQLSDAFPRPEQQRILQQVDAALDAPDPQLFGPNGIHRMLAALPTSPASPKPEFDEDAPLGRPNRIELDLERAAEHICGSACDVIRLFTYYEMKNRAAVVGQQGLGPLLSRLGDAAHVRIHLMGHSFGARLVAHTLVGIGGAEQSPIASLTLLQGAFSHFSFAPAVTHAPDPGVPGALNPLVGLVAGPLLATFTGADRALGDWYPMATMLQRGDLALLDHPTYRWGAMGHDGFQQPDAVTLPLGPQGTPYGFGKGGIYRLDANAVINADLSAFSGAHSDICHAEVLWAVVSAARLT
ncbi:hypothetical protein [Kitasatospora sp. LaBMicrA B282]|uniref:hypothetical protein n=1 Tax=Kitasatospora sp. LaBMicrA B282 TaxID=3420949 RepID=UPI003D10D3EA